MIPLEITFQTDGTGIIWSLNEPHHLDGIIGYHWRMREGKSMDCNPELQPDNDPLPLTKWRIGETWGWKASILIPVGLPIESVQFARKRFDEKRIEYQDRKTVNTAVGLCKTTNKPWPVVTTNYWKAWCVGDRSEVTDLAKRVRHIGRERARGRGGVVNVIVEPCSFDKSLVWEGKAMRYLPQEGAPRFARCRPPYWHMHERYNVCDAGDNYE